MLAASGGRYPAEAAWATHLVDRYSVPMSGTAVRGIARRYGGATLYEFRPATELWSRMALDRINALSVDVCHRRAMQRLSRYVEFEVVAWMVESNTSHAEIVINRTPCGYRPDLGERVGCHQYLPAMLPRGFTLDVYGTDDNGDRAFRARYEGRG